MKKLLSALSVSALLLAGCSSNTTSSSAVSSASSVDEPTTSSAMTYAEYAAADVDTEVSVETYVQDKQGWWEDNGVGKATLYTQDKDGAYFIYNLEMSEDEYNQLVEGQKIAVTGYKTVWSGEIEIIDATFEILDGNYVAEAVDVTNLLADDSLIDFQNQKVSFTGLEVVAANDSNDAFLYSWDGSGSDGDDLYFNVSDGTNTYSFTVESYLRGAGTEVYEAVKALNVGDVIDAEGFLYWYEGANPHITSVTVK